MNDTHTTCAQQNSTYNIKNCTEAQPLPGKYAQKNANSVVNSTKYSKELNVIMQ